MVELRCCLLVYYYHIPQLLILCLDEELRGDRRHVWLILYKLDL